MKSKKISGFILLLALTVSQSALACDACWYNVGLKEWFANFNPGVGPTRGEQISPQVTLTAGYDRFFINFSVNPEVYYVSPTDASKTLHGQSGLNIGYIPIPDLLIAVGSKSVWEQWSDMPAPYPSDGMRPSGEEPSFTTVGAAYSYVVSDSAFAINGSVTYGQRTLTVDTTKYTGSTGGSSAYLGYDLGVSYAMTKSWKASAYYRVEQWDAMAPISTATTPYLANVAMVKMTAGGPGVGVAYSF